MFFKERFLARLNILDQFEAGKTFNPAPILQLPYSVEKCNSFTIGQINKINEKTNKFLIS